MAKTTKLNAVTLSNPVNIDGKDVTEIALMKPSVGQLRGLSLMAVLQMDISAMMRLLPRISQPPLSPDQVADLDPADFTALAVRTTLFFAKKEQLEGQLLDLKAN